MAANERMPRVLRMDGVLRDIREDLQGTVAHWNRVAVNGVTKKQREEAVQIGKSVMAQIARIDWAIEDDFPPLDPAFAAIMVPAGVTN